MKAMQMAQLRRANAEESRIAWRAGIDAALRTLAAAGVSAALGLGVWQGWRWVNTTPDFALRAIHFSGLVHAREDELIARSGLQLGENLFRADLTRAAQAMQSHPWVASARLERRPPGTVLASIAEHRPAALVQLGELYVLDDEGKLFKRAAPDDRLDLPLITGLARETWQDQQLRLFGALHLLDTWQAAGFALAALSEVRLEEGGGFTLFAREGAQVQEIRLGTADLSLKLKRLAQVRAALARRGEQAARIDLDNPARPDQAAATLADKR
jgi:cell division protein FtsQ